MGLILQVVFVALFIISINCQVQVSYESSLSSTTYANPDNYGYRYCAAWKLADGTPVFTTCDPYNIKRCGKTLEFQYDCCPGFSKSKSDVFSNNAQGNPVCGTTTPPSESCSKVLKNLGIASELSGAIGGDSNFGDKPACDFTIFAPLKGPDSSSLYPVVKGRYYVDNLVNNQELTSVYNNQKLLVTKYSFGVVCIDCIEISKSSMECKNGVIHVMRKSLVAGRAGGADKKNLYASLQADSDISSFVGDIPSDMVTLLQSDNAGKRYTVFPVSNSAWSAIKSKYSGDALASIVRNHIVDKLLCSAALYKSSEDLTTASKESISAQCDTEGNQEVRYMTDACGNKVKLTKNDNMATNGVYHTVDNALIPIAARTLKDVIEDPKCKSSFFLQAQQFLGAIKKCNLNMKKGKKYTVLVPMDVSFNWWKGYKQFSEEYKQFQNSAAYRCRVARYHIMEQNPELNNLATLRHHQKGYKSNNKGERFEANYFLKNKDYSNLYFHYSPVAGFKSNQFQDGSMYRISRINVIPEKYMIDVLGGLVNAKTTYGQAKQMDMNGTVWNPNRPLNLFLATVDEGLMDSKTGKLHQTIAGYSGKSLTNYLLLHTIPHYLWGGDIGYFKKNTIHRFMSRVGIELIFWRDANGDMKIGYDGLDKSKWAKVVKFNIPAIDGIIWLLNRWIECPKKLCPHKERVIDYDLFDVYVTACQYKEIPGISSEAAARAEFNARPIKIAIQNPTKCAIYKQKTHKATKEVKG